MRGDSARSTSGNGLGLAIVQRIIDAHSGKLKIGCSARQGLRIRAYLPRCRSHQWIKASAKPKTPAKTPTKRWYYAMARPESLVAFGPATVVRCLDEDGIPPLVLSQKVLTPWTRAR